MARDWTVRLSPRGGWRYGAALGLVAASTVVAEIIYRLFDTDRLSMVFLAGVLVAAVVLGPGPAYFAAAAAFVVYDIYLVQPRGEFTLTSAEDVIVLVVFLAVAVLTGGLAGRLREAQRRAEARARTSGALFRASEEFSASDDENAVRQALAHRIADAGRPAVIFYGDRIWVSAEGLEAPAAVAQLATTRSVSQVATVQCGSWRLRPLRAEGQAAGVAAWGAASADRGDDDERLIDVLVDIAGVAIARSRLAGARAEIQARERTEQLRNALLSSISHDLRTPLAAILASASSLREFGDRFDPEVRDDLMLTIQEETERLNIFVGNLLNMTKLESGALTVSQVAFGMGEVVERVVERVRRRAGARELVIQANGDLSVLGDPILAEQALANVVENAVRFTVGEARIDVAARRQDGRVVVEVVDEGPGVPQAELPLLFEKFYRSPTTSANQQGTGLGLSIARGLVEAMGGEVSARGRDDARSGLVVAIALPGSGP
jgi:two-component system sensor histidine kinase KdpD